MSIFSSKPKASQKEKKKNRGGNPTLYSPENQLAHKDTTISPLDSHRLLQQECPPTPSQPVETGNATFKIYFFA